jgi:Do/DeqQ family serine protease
VKRVLLPLLLLVIGLGVGWRLSGRVHFAPATSPPTTTESDRPSTETPPSSASVQQPPPAADPDDHAAPVTPLGGVADFTGVASRAVKGVANISSVQVTRTSNSPFADDPFFRYFFGDQEDLFGSRNRRSLSLGSGVVVSPDGYVVTNSHVVGEDVRRIRDVTVALSDKRDVPGTVIGTDPATDIALLKIDVKGLTPLPWGDSSTLQVGEWVLAIGSPFQLSQTVTAGIVSATGRTNVGFAQYEDFIQTDAAINPGNSGGALVNARGELVGINTGIFSQSGGYQGIGFAVPSLLARRVVEDLIKYGEVRRGYMAIQAEALTPQIAAQLRLESTAGVLVVGMDRTVYDAGMRQYDVIVGFNGRPVGDQAQLFRLVADAPVGSPATLTVVREGQQLTIKVPILASSSARG